MYIFIISLGLEMIEMSFKSTNSLDSIAKNQNGFFEFTFVFFQNVSCEWKVEIAAKSGTLDKP